ncbi:uncharacterized protein [Lepeophtheirus salmonis]|uniref:uncharacterized protein n=1 Tax=Lepeophtheirus salmonis TaxID=72036 RepID=UPI001AEA258B|nr:uncharacterized protein LOC121124209 [Lepeophtheirus salmonis]
MQNLPINLDHYNTYVRALLPPIPHCIESCQYSDSLNWECTLSVALLSESDCMKWLTDFIEISKTNWKVNKNIALTNVLNKKVLWGMVYQCETNATKNCPAKLELKILSLSENDKIKSKTTYPCLISIHFHHNHSLSSLTNKSSSNMNSDIPSHIKEHFEGYFLETIETRNGGSPVTSTNNGASNHGSTSSNSHPSGTRVVILNQGNPPQIISSQDMGVVFDIEDVNNKLDEQLGFLKALLKQSGTGCAAVKQFTDQFDRIKNDSDHLENALINFGIESHTAQILHHHPPVNSGDILSVSNPVQWAQPTTILSDNGPDDIFSKTNNLLLTNHNNNNIINGNGNILEEDEDSLKNKKGKKKKLNEVSPGQIDPVTGKRKKRSRCGTCSGCINRDKTQDCRECRNCLDQKRYGGPGRLKKACIKRSCVVMCTADTSSSHHQGQQQQQTSTAQISSLSLPTNISLPIHSTSAVGTTSSNGNPTGVGGTTVIAASSSVTLGPQGSVLSWPAGTQFAPTFQVQQPVQFTYQPQTFEDSTGVVQTTSTQRGNAVVTTSPTTTLQYATQSIKLDSLTKESVGHQGIT